MKTLMITAALALAAGLAYTAPADAAAAGAAGKAVNEVTNGSNASVETVHYRRYRKHRGPSLYFSYGYVPRYYGYTYVRPRYYSYAPRYYRSW